MSGLMESPFSNARRPPDPARAPLTKCELIPHDAPILTPAEDVSRAKGIVRFWRCAARHNSGLPTCGPLVRHGE